MSLFNEQPFYHQTVRNLVVAFGEIFSGITITKRDHNNDKEQIIPVPIQYGPRNKWLTMLKQDPDKTNNMNAITPMIAFEITDYKYDANRKIGTHGSFLTGTIGNKRSKIFNPVPYDVYINLYSFTKTQDESLQILEQILPYFAPSMTIELVMVPQFNIVKNVPIVLSNVSVQDTYEGDMSKFRTVEQTFTFVAQLDLFGPVIKSTKVIKTAKVDLSLNPVASMERLETKVVPTTANKNEDHTITETWGFV